ncbi:class I adenylate-forming enzyme family protein [Nakamurella flava]|nr:class I adenylate-forming enzyme family protein [Nakamurella flava]
MNDQQRPPRVPTPGENVADLIRRAAADHPDRPAVLGAGGPRTWAQVDAAVDAGVRDLRRRGLTPGERIVIALPTGADLALVLSACARAGAVAVPIGPQPEAVGAVAERVDAFGAVASTLPTGFPLVVDTERIARWWDASAGPAERPAAGGEDLAWLARPFGDRLVMLSHRAVRAAVTALLGLEGGLRDGDRLLQVLPLHHLSGWVTTFLPVAAVGGAAVFPAVSLDAVRAEGRSPAAGSAIDGVLAAVTEHRVTVISGAAAFYHQLAAGREAQEIVDHLSTVRILTSGVPPFESDDRRTADVLAEVGPVWPSYGLAESASVVSTTLVGAPDDPPRPGSAGRPVAGLSLRVSGQEATGTTPAQVSDPDEDAPAEAAGGAGWDDALDVLGDGGEIGEVGPIALRGATLFSGYWPDGRGGPGADGWWVSRDLGYLDDGELHVVDRAGGVLRVTGFPVYPLEVEQELLAHPWVRAAAVVGERSGPSAMSDSRVVAVVVLKAERSDLPALDEDGSTGDGPAVASDQDVVRVLAEHVATRLPAFKRPVAYHFVAELPLTDVGRVDRVAARRRFATAPGLSVPRLAVVPDPAATEPPPARDTAADGTGPSAADSPPPGKPAEGRARKGRSRRSETEKEPAAVEPAEPEAVEVAPEVAPEPVGDLDDLGVRLPAAGDRSDRGRQDTDDDLF